MQPQLLTIAEILQQCGASLPPDAERTAATTELLMEARYETLEIERFVAELEPQAHEVHMYKLEQGEHAEAVLAAELPAEHRTKMILARCLQRKGALSDGETLQSAWSSLLMDLQARAAPHLPAPPAK